MSDILDCGHPYGCLEDATDADEARRAPCRWCDEIATSEKEKRYLLGEAAKLKGALVICEEELADSERDNKALVDQLGKQSLMLQPGKHDFGNVEIGYLVMLPGASIDGSGEPLTITNEPLNVKTTTYEPKRINPTRHAETTAESEREPCPECGKPAEIVSFPFGANAPFGLSCGCKTKNEEWLKRSHAQDKEYYGQQNGIHKDHARKCPCDRCRAAGKGEPTKSPCDGEIEGG